MERPGWSLRFLLSGTMLVSFACASLVVVLLVHQYMRAQALMEAEAKAMILLDRTMATHEYFSRQLKPRVFTISDRFMPQDYFDPVWMSSTHANRQINNYFNARSSAEYYYKDAAINARSPENEADEFERQFITALNQDPGLENRTSVRLWHGEPYFFVLRRGERMEGMCLRCHSTPEAAPQQLVDFYGPKRSFGRENDQVISAISIRIPLAAAYGQANRVAWRLSALLVLLLTMLVGLHLVVHRRFLFSPLARLRDKTRQISEDSTHLGEELALPQGSELRELAVSFNSMLRDLRFHRDHLEAEVAARTASLSEEIVRRRRYQEESEQLIVQLKKALDQVKTLSGLLPICCFCKKIRDDQGYWQQLEGYLHSHSGAEFSHGICPECLERNYPESGDNKG